eukprot:scaffold7151_cov33-Tisochrysis_lutea.AAC.2
MGAAVGGGRRREGEVGERFKLREGSREREYIKSGEDAGEMHFSRSLLVVGRRERESERERENEEHAEDTEGTSWKQRRQRRQKDECDGRARADAEERREERERGREGWIRWLSKGRNTKKRTKIVNCARWGQRTEERARAAPESATERR